MRYTKLNQRSVEEPEKKIKKCYAFIVAMCTHTSKTVVRPTWHMHYIRAFVIFPPAGQSLNRSSDCSFVISAKIPAFLVKGTELFT